jgi:hypothetical protein
MRQLALPMLIIFLSLHQQTLAQDSSSQFEIEIKTPTPSLGLFAVPSTWKWALTNDRSTASNSDSATVNKPSLLLTTPILALYPQSLKYNTTKSNPDHWCYEFRRPLPKRVDFLFNFLSERKYNPNRF